MSRKRVSRNALCPCGSGKKYKHCCYHKGFEWQEDDGGNIHKSIPMSSEVSEIIEQQRQKFIDKYGREPGQTNRCSSTCRPWSTSSIRWFRS